MDEIRAFYDGLSAGYHLVYEDWWRSVERQGQVLDRIICERLGPGPRRILDCTAGIGTQSLGLAIMGHTVLGTDLSGLAIARAEVEARSRDLAAEFRTWDVRSVGDLPGGPFDVVLSADNSLPHLIDSDHLRAAVRGIWSQTESPGLALVTMRDYDRLLESKPPLEGPRILGKPGHRRIVLQLWDWDHVEPIYRLEHLMISEGEGGGWVTSSWSCSYRALRRGELEGHFRFAGASEFEWLEPELSGFFQPVLCATRGVSV